MIISVLSAEVDAADWHHLRISEIMAEDGDYMDWIEIFNSGSQPVLLENLYLSDDPDDPKKWQFPSDLIIQPRGFEVFWADGMDAGRHTNFKLKQKGENVGIFDPEGGRIDSVDYGKQTSGVSFGRHPDEGSVWLFFGEPTPGNENNTKGYPEYDATDTPPCPQFSLQGGFYTGRQLISLSSQLPDAEIRYTLDGSEPARSSSLYTKPIIINSTTVVSARVFDAGCFSGPVMTQTYFIQESHTLPVISIATDPAHLWDDETGIYTEGTNYDSFEGIANYLEDWERPIRLEFYETDGTPGFNMNAGMKIHGGSGRDYLQKSVSVHARERFGADEIAYKIFPDEDISTFKSFILRNDGCCDDLRTLFRDAILHRIVKGRMDIDLQAYRPSVVFLNGEYWGILNFREKLNEHYLASHHGVDPDDVDLLEENSSVVEGDAKHYENLLNFIETADMTSGESYEYIRTQMEVNEYINYQIAEIFSANSDWPDNNIKYWRPKTPEGKWRWLLYDTDYAFTDYKYDGIEKAYGTQMLFRKLLENPEFKNEFIQRFASYLNTTFRPERVIFVIDSLRKGIETEMPNHIRKWGGKYGSHSISSISEWEDNIEKRKEFATQRLSYVREHIKDHFGLSGTVKFTLGTSEPCTGRILINGAPMPTGDFTGIWFKNVPLRLEAVPNTNSRFVRWEGIADGNQEEISVTLTEASAITAVFERIEPTEPFSSVPGDIDSDGHVTLCDAIMAIRICAGQTTGFVVLQNDISGDGKIGTEETIYILRKVSCAF
ncbi:CotH kinase family protein [Desulfonema magnum]|nr:CotH kinase family protein [Desulfonema magnum]